MNKNHDNVALHNEFNNDRYESVQLYFQKITIDLLLNGIIVILHKIFIVRINISIITCLTKQMVINVSFVFQFLLMRLKI